MRYVPNIHTRRAFQRCSQTIGFFFRSSPLLEQNPASANTDLNFSSALMSAHRELVANGYELLFCEVTENMLKNKRHIVMAREKMLDGALVWGPLNKDNYVRDLLDEKLPLVQLSGRVENLDAPSVNADDYQGMREIVKAVLKAGHKKIALLRPQLSSDAGHQRYTGVIDELTENKITPAAVFVPKDFGYAAAIPVAKRFYKKNHGATCVITMDDMAAWGFIDVLSEAGVKIPQNLSITGADGLFFPGKIHLSSYTRPSAQIGKNAAEMLLDLINGKNIANKHQLLPVTHIAGNTIAKIKYKV
jgi:LacI family transcriptional regulator